MNKKIKTKNLHLFYNDIFPYGVAFMCDCQFADVKEQFTFNSGAEIGDSDVSDADGFSFFGIYKKTKKKFAVIWVENFAEKPEYGLITHEAIHAACEVFNGIGVPISYDNQETIAYYVQWIVEQIIKIASKKV